MNCAPENRKKLRDMIKNAIRELKTEPVEGVEPKGLFYPRGSNYDSAVVIKYKDYATWEKRQAETAEARQEGISIITEQTDMFFEEI